MKFGLGCLRELPDPRDWYIESHPAAMKFFHSKPVFGKAIESWSPASGSVDLREWCSPIENQGQLGSCTAQTAAGMVEFLERRAHGRYTDASRLFIYKTTRNLLGWEGDTGAYIRSAMKALTIFGAPPERTWPYDVKRFDDEPSAYCYAYGQSFQALRYFRLDHAQQDRQQRLDLMKAVLYAHIPIGLGFVVYNAGNKMGEFAMPTKADAPMGGHAVMLCGYDDARQIGDSTGAFIVRNSWGTEWGEDGYGWLPYDYVLHDLAWDIWALFKVEYLDEAQF